MSVIVLKYRDIKFRKLELQDIEFYSFLLELFKYDYRENIHILAANFEKIAGLIFPLLFKIDENLAVLLKNDAICSGYREASF